MKQIFIFILINFLSIGFIFCQESDSVTTDSTTIDSNKVVVKKKEKKVIEDYEIYPRKAAFRSAILPGWGQFSNYFHSNPRRPHWLKVPLIYGALATTSYLVYSNNKNYQDYKWAYYYAEDGDSSTSHVLNNRFPNSSTLKTYRDDFRKNRDLFVIITAAVYALNIVDAYVFAHLMDFDVSSDLSFRASPTIFSNIANRPAAGFTFQLKF